MGLVPFGRLGRAQFQLADESVGAGPAHLEVLGAELLPSKAQELMDTVLTHVPQALGLRFRAAAADHC